MAMYSRRCLRPRPVGVRMVDSVRLEIDCFQPRDFSAAFVLKHQGLDLSLPITVGRHPLARFLKPDQTFTANSVNAEVVPDEEASAAMTYIDASVIMVEVNTLKLNRVELADVRHAMMQSLAADEAIEAALQGKPQADCRAKDVDGKACC